MIVNSRMFLTIYLLAAFGWSRGARCTAEISPGFPLETGTYWIYECHLSQRDLGSKEIKQKSMTWKMQILETQQHGDVTVAHLKGYLDDARRDLGTHGGQDYLMVRTGADIFYLIGPFGSEEVAARLKTTQTDWAREAERHGRILLELPLVIGEGFPSEQEAQLKGGAHRPGFDSWLVKGRREVKLDRVKANVPLGSRMQYSLVNGLNKSAKTVEFIPGVGITSYDYHGYAGVAPDSAEWEGHFKLIEFFRGEPTVTLGIEVSLPDDAVFYIPAVGDGEIRGMVSLAKHPHSWIRITPRMRADSMKTEVSALPKADKKEPEANSDGENGKGADAGSYEGKEGSLLFSGLGQLGLPVLKARVVRAYGPPPGGFHHPYANSSAFCSCHFSKPRSIVDSDGSASSGVVGIISYPDAGKCVEISGCGRCCRTSLP